MDDDYYSGKETERRRDEVMRRMANTPPQPKSKAEALRQKTRKKADADRGPRKDRAGHER